MMPHKKTIEVLFSFVKINWTDLILKNEMIQRIELKICLVFYKRCTHMHLSGKKNHNGISDRERIFRSNPRQRVGAILR